MSNARCTLAWPQVLAGDMSPAGISERERSAPPGGAEGDSGPEMSKDRLAVALALVPSVIGYALAAQGGSAAPSPRAAGLAMVGAAAPRLHSHLGGTLLPPAESVRAPQGLGALNVLPDRDGRLRCVRLVVQWGEEVYPSLAAEVLRVATGAGSYVVRIAADAVTDVPLSIRIGPLTVPLNDNGEIWLHYAPRASLPALGAAEVLAGGVPPPPVAERIVLTRGVAKPRQEPAGSGGPARLSQSRWVRCSVRPVSRS